MATKTFPDSAQRHGQVGGKFVEVAGDYVETLDIVHGGFQRWWLLEESHMQRLGPKSCVLTPPRNPVRRSIYSLSITPGRHHAGQKRAFHALELLNGKMGNMKLKAVKAESANDVLFGV